MLMLVPFFVIVASCCVGYYLHNLYSRRAAGWKVCAPGELVDVNFNEAVCFDGFPNYKHRVEPLQ